MLCLIEVFIVLGELISHSLSLLMTWNHVNLAITGITSLNIVSLILLHLTSRRYNDRMTVCHYHRADSSVGPYSELLRDHNVNANQVIDKKKTNKIQFIFVIFVCLSFDIILNFNESNTYYSIDYTMLLSYERL